MQFLNNYRITINLSLSIALLYFVFGTVPEALYFNAEQITRGELWRYMTGHLVHSDTQHLILNLAVFIILSALIEQHSRLLLFTALFTGIVFINLYLFSSNEVINYAGLSGVLNTLLIMALYQQWQLHTKPLSLTGYFSTSIYLISSAKIMYKLYTRDSLFSHTLWPSLPQAHLVGFIAGTILVLLIHFLIFLSYLHSPLTIAAGMVLPANRGDLHKIPVYGQRLLLQTGHNPA